MAVATITQLGINSVNTIATSENHVEFADVTNGGMSTPVVAAAEPLACPYIVEIERTFCSLATGPCLRKSSCADEGEQRYKKCF